MAASSFKQVGNRSKLKLFELILLALARKTNVQKAFEIKAQTCRIKSALRIIHIVVPADVWICEGRHEQWQWLRHSGFLVAQGGTLESLFYFASSARPSAVARKALPSCDIRTGWGFGRLRWQLRAEADTWCQSRAWLKAFRFPISQPHESAAW